MQEKISCLEAEEQSIYNNTLDPEDIHSIRSPHAFDNSIGSRNNIDGESVSEDIPVLRRRKNLQTLVIEFVNSWAFNTALGVLNISIFMSILIFLSSKNKVNFEWMENSPDSKYFLISLLFLYVQFYFIVYRLINAYFLPGSSDTKFFQGLMHTTPASYILLIYLTDRSIIPSKMDLFIWLFITYFYAISNSSLTMINEAINRILSSNLSSTIIKARIKKVDVFLLYIISSVVFCITLTTFMLWHGGFYLLALIQYMGVCILVEGLRLLLTFKHSRNLGLSLNNNDLESNKGFFANIILNTIVNAIKLAHYYQLFSHNGLNLSIILVQLFIINKMQKLTFNILTNFKRFKKFFEISSSFNKRYPLLMLSSSDMKDCPICMEKLLKARKLPCGHMFHQFCLMRMVENGYKTCAICRSDIYHNPQRDVNAQGHNSPGFRDNRNNNNSFMNWLPSFDFNFINDAAITEESIERGKKQLLEVVREVFPEVARQDIINELRNTGSVHGAIYNLSEVPNFS